MTAEDFIQNSVQQGNLKLSEALKILQSPEEDAKLTFNFEGKEYYITYKEFTEVLKSMNK